MMEEKRKVPKIRFPEYTDEWEQCKLDNILTERHVLSKISDEYPRLSFTIEEGVIDPEDRKTNKRDFLMKDEANKKFLLTEIGDIIYNPANVVFGAIHRNSYRKGCLSPIYRIFETNQESRFLECVVRSETFISKLAQKTEGSVVKLKTLKPEAFLGMNVYVSSSLGEQKEIAAFFEKLDNLITLYQRRCEYIKIYKKYLIQKMFPQNGKKMPEIRFPGFTDGWEQRKLGDQMYIKSRIGWQALTRNEYLETGDYYLITGTDIDEGSHTVDLKRCYYVSKERYEMDDKIQVREGDIIVTKDGTIGKVAMVTGLDKPATLNSHLFVLRDLSGNLDNRYLLQMLNSHIFDTFVNSTRTGSTLTGLPQKTFVEFQFPVPRYEEQKQISGFFDNLDNLITLHQRQYEKYKKLKAGLLQNMFV